MIWKFIVSAIALTLALTSGTNAQTPWVKTRYESPGGNPFAFDYYDDHIIVRNYDLNGSNSHIYLYKLRKGLDHQTKFSIIVTWDRCANLDVDDSIGVRFSFDRRLDGSMSRKFVVQSTGTNWCQIQPPIKKWSSPSDWDTTNYNDYLADFDELWIELSLDVLYFDEIRDFGALGELSMGDLDKSPKFKKYLHFNISGQPDLSW